MKANELMIEDWVMNTHNRKPEQIREILERMVMLDYNDLYNYDEIEPISLTPEILARMGFTIEEVHKYDDTYTEDEYIATMKCVDSRKCEVEIEYKTYWKKLRAFNYDPRNRLGFTSIETQVEYVHELQHIMRICGIEKEIVI